MNTPICSPTRKLNVHRLYIFSLFSIHNNQLFDGFRTLQHSFLFTMEKESNKTGKRIQLLTTLIINLLAVATGASFGIANVLISDLQSKESQNNNSLQNSTVNRIQKGDIFSFSIDVQESTWIATFGMIGQYFPILFVGPIVARFGKRVSMQIDSILFVIGFLLMGLSIDVRMIYASKFLMGYAYLTSRSSIQPFTFEIADPNIRGFASALWSLSFTIGQANSIFLAGAFGWRQVSGFFAALMLVCFLALIWPHETPEWLMEKWKFQTATKSYEFYKSDKGNIVEDKDKRVEEDGTEKSYQDLVDLCKEEKEKESCSNATEHSENSANHNTKSATFKKLISEKKTFVLSLLKSPEFYKPFRFLIVTFALLELSGFAVLANFSIVLMETYGYGKETFVDAATLVTIISLTRIPLGITTGPVLQKFKKRPTYLLVCAILILILAGIISFTTLVENGTLSQKKIQSSYILQAIPFVLFILFYSGFAFGYGNIPFALMGELFPPNISNAANTAIFVIVNSVELTTVYTALLIKDKYGLQYVFVIPAVAIFLSAIWAAIFMPETHGLSIKQIRMLYKSSPNEPKNESHHHQDRNGVKEKFDAYKNTLRKASMTLWSTDVCVTAMKVVDGKNHPSPLQDMFTTAKAIIGVKNAPNTNTTNDQRADIDTPDKTIKGKHPQINLEAQQDESTKQDFSQRGV